MGHEITALVIAGAFDAEVARSLDLEPVPLASSLTFFHIDHYYTAYWQAVRRCTVWLDVPDAFPGLFPREGVVVALVAELTAQAAPVFALIRTEYFGGVGDQWAAAFRGARRESSDDARINTVLRTLGVVPRDGLDEFDTVGLAEHRDSPESLERYRALCRGLGV